MDDPIARKLVSIAYVDAKFAGLPNVGTGIAKAAVGFYDETIARTVLAPDTLFCLVNYAPAPDAKLNVEGDHQTALRVLTGGTDIPAKLPLSVKGDEIVVSLPDNDHVIGHVLYVEGSPDEPTLLRLAAERKNGPMAVALYCLCEAGFDVDKATKMVPSDISGLIVDLKNKRDQTTTAVAIAKTRYGMYADEKKMRMYGVSPEDPIVFWILDTCKNDDILREQTRLLKSFSQQFRVSASDSIPSHFTPGQVTSTLLKRYSDSYTINYQVIHAYVAKLLNDDNKYNALMSDITMHNLTAAEVLKRLDFAALRREAELSELPNFPTFEKDGKKHDLVVVRASKYIDLDGTPFHERNTPFRIFNPPMVSTSIVTNVIDPQSMFARQGGVILVLSVPETMEDAIYMEGTTGGMHAGEEEVLFHAGSTFEIHDVRHLAIKNMTVLFGRVVTEQTGGGEVPTAPVIDVGDLSDSQLSTIDAYVKEKMAVTVTEPTYAREPLPWLNQDVRHAQLAHGGAPKAVLSWTNAFLAAVVIVSSILGSR